MRWHSIYEPVTFVEMSIQAYEYSLYNVVVIPIVTFILL